MPLELNRTVRFCINPASNQTGNDSGLEQRADNTFAGYPSFRGIGRYFEIDVVCRGEVDPVSGYFLNIKVIDQAVRAAAVPILTRACERQSADADLATLLAEIAGAVNSVLNRTVVRVRWRLTPFFSLERSMAHPETVFMRQQFEFAASHRLHCPSLSDEENRRLFGKCNHPGGHGHNYRVEPCIRVATRPAAARGFGLAELEHLTNREVIERFDHKHLNEDVAAFRAKSDGGRGLNPSVENIAMVCFELLQPAVHAAGHGEAELENVTVWETDKTSCTYPARG